MQLFTISSSSVSSYLGEGLMFQVVLESVSEPTLLQAKQPAPSDISHMTYSLETSRLCCPYLKMLQHLNVFLKSEGPRTGQRT